VRRSSASITSLAVAQVGGFSDLILSAHACPASSFLADSWWAPQHGGIPLAMAWRQVRWRCDAMWGEGMMAGGMIRFSLLAGFSPLLVVLGSLSCIMMMIEPRAGWPGLGLWLSQTERRWVFSFGSMGEFQKFGNRTA